MTPEQKAAIEAARARLAAGGMSPAQVAALSAARERARLVGLAGAGANAVPVDPGVGGIAPVTAQTGIERGPMAPLTPEGEELLGGMAQRRAEAEQTNLGAFGKGALQGATFGFSDEIGAGMIAPFVDGSYSDVRDAVRGDNAAAASAKPLANIAGLVAGGVAVPGIGTARAVTAAPTVGRSIVNGALAGAATGGLTGAGMSDGDLGDRLTAGGYSALIGAVLGGAISGAGSKIVNALQARSARNAMMRAAPSADDLATDASAIFNRADAVTDLPRANLTAAFPAIDDAATRSGLDDMLTPQAARAVSRVEDAASNPNPNMTFRELDILRRQAGVPAGDAANRTQAAIGVRLQDQLDDVLDGANAGLSGEVAAARSMWGRMRRSELVDGAMSRASNVAGGLEKGIRDQLRAILNNPKKLRGFSEAEIAQMREVVQGAAIGNIARKVGKIGPGIGQQTNMLGAGLGSAAGVGLLSPLGPWASAVGAFAAPAIGAAGQKVAEASTRRSAAVLEALVRSGGQMPPAAKSEIGQAIIAALMGQTGQGSSELQSLLVPRATTGR